MKPTEIIDRLRALSDPAAREALTDFASVK